MKGESNVLARFLRGGNGTGKGTFDLPFAILYLIWQVAEERTDNFATLQVCKIAKCLERLQHCKVPKRTPLHLPSQCVGGFTN